MTCVTQPDSPATKHMFVKLLTSALFAGFAAGLIAVTLQFAFVQPLLLEAELYESGDIEHFSMRIPHDHSAEHTGDEAETPLMTLEDADHDHASHDHGRAPEGGIDFKRDGLTVLFSVFTYAGYALMLVATFAFAETRGIRITPRAGLLWGLSGFIAVQFAPSLGLAPELPGNAAADIDVRQYWWLATVVLTAVGLWFVAFGKSTGLYALGAGAILLPHLIGAPQPDGFNGASPPELAALYATRTLGMGLVAWLSLGLAASYFWTQNET